ncbi:SpaA isopeptide-forming pilin-related protein [Streptococcus pneumoniae]
MFYKKKLLIISTILLLLLSIVPHNIVRALEDVAGVKVDAYYTSLNENQAIRAGETAIYRLDFYASGIDGASQEPVGLTIKLPDNTDGKTSLASNLEELKLADQVPVYDAESNSLKYTFDNLTTGQAYNLTLRVNTQNGTIPNDTTLKTEAIFTQGDREITRKPAQVTVSSDTEVALSKSYAYTVGHENEPNYVPKANDVVVWKGKVEVPKKEFGQAFIKEGSTITVSDTIQQNQTYVSASGDGARVSSNGSTITLDFEAPTLADQADPNRTNLFEKEVEIRTRLGNYGSSTATFKNKLKVDFQNISEKNVQAESNEAQVVSGKPDSTSTPAPNGTIITGINRGPQNGDGRLADLRQEGNRVVNFNPNPTVPDTATLSFEMVHRAGFLQDQALNDHDLSYYYPYYPWNEAGAELAKAIARSGYEWVNMYRKVDPALILDQIQVWEPLRWMNINQAARHYNPIPKTLVRMKVTDLNGNPLRTETVNVDWNKMQPSSSLSNYAGQGGVVILNRDDLHLNSGERVSQYEVLYQNPNSSPIIAGDFWGNVVDVYKIKPGTSGTVTNTSWVDFATSRGSYWKDALGGRENTNSTLGARTARITPTTQPIPIIDVAVGLKKADGNVVTAGVPQAGGGVSEKGKNRLSLTLTNRHPSLVEATGPISMFAVLPPGVTPNPNYEYKVTLTQKDGKEKKTINVDNKNTLISLGKDDHNRDVVILNWNAPDAKLQVGDSVNLEINVNVANTVDPTFTIDGYGTVGNPDFTVPAGALDPIIDTTDIDYNNNSTEKLAVAKATYKLADSRDLQIKKLVKGELDSDYSTFGHTNVGGKIDYRLEITNTTGDVIRRMGFMDVLPNIGDTAVTSTTQRGSKFRPILTGPIGVPAEWQDKVTVYYTTVATPSRADLYAKVDYPEGASQPDAMNAEDPNWQTADTISDWSAVTAFKVELNDGVAWIPGQGIHMDFQMKAPDNPEAPVVDATVNEKERAAWNSFSVTTNGLFAVEPEKVGVALQPVAQKYRLKIVKVNEENGKIADSKTRFAIRKEKNASAPVYNEQTATLNQNGGGEFIFDNKRNKFEPGTYYIFEEKAPAGYVKLKEPVELTISDKGEISVSEKDRDRVNITKEDGTDIIEIRIKNIKPGRFPNTGGIGTAIFILSGMSLMLVSGLRLRKRNTRRMR